MTDQEKPKSKYQPPKCEFCGHTAQQGADIVVSPNGKAICTDCAEKALVFSDADVPLLVAKAQKAKKPKLEGKRTTIPTPREIVKILDEHVVGQAEVKKTLATAVYNHYSRLKSLSSDNEGDELKDVTVEKSNIMMIGPTGCGKTLLAKTIAKILDVPFAIADATTLTEAGYVGEDVENIVRYAYNNAGGNRERTEQALIWIDEVDKIASKTQNVSITRDVSGEGVQQALLKIIEGTICRFPPNGGRKHPDQQLVEIDTNNILFICGGAFVGLDKIVEKRVKEESGASVIGFESDETKERKKANTENRIRPEDLVEYGLIPEFVGRIPIISEMKELTEEDLVRVMVEPKNSITKQYRKLLKQNQIELHYEEGALKALAQRAVERKTGARGLRAEMEEVMKDILFEAPENKEPGKVITITEEMVKNVA